LPDSRSAAALEQAAIDAPLCRRRRSSNPAAAMRSRPGARKRQYFAGIGVERPIGVPFNTGPRPRAPYMEVATVQGLSSAIGADDVAAAGG